MIIILVFYISNISPICEEKLKVFTLISYRLRLEYVGTCAETRFRLSRETGQVHLNATTNAQKPDFVFRAKRDESI